MIREAKGLSIENHIKQNLNEKSTSSLHNSRRNFYRVRRKVLRDIDHKKGDILIHESVKKRWLEMGDNYKPKNLVTYLEDIGGWDNVKLIK